MRELQIEAGAGEGLTDVLSESVIFQLDHSFNHSIQFIIVWLLTLTAAVGTSG